MGTDAAAEGRGGTAGGGRYKWLRLFELGRRRYLHLPARRFARRLVPEQEGVLAADRPDASRSRLYVRRCDRANSVAAACADARRHPDSRCCCRCSLPSTVWYTWYNEYSESRAKDEIGNWTKIKLPLDVWGLGMSMFCLMSCLMSHPPSGFSRRSRIICMHSSRRYCTYHFHVHVLLQI